MPDDEEWTQLEEWLETMNPRLGRLEDFEVRGFPVDYSRASLDHLEREVLRRGPVDDRPDNRSSFVDAAMGYLGETLLNTAGGRWEWDDETGTPVVCPDPALKRDPISPVSLIVAAARRGTGHEFAQVHEALERAVADRQAADSSWSPTKEPTPGVDVVERTGGSAYLDRWLPERETAFPRWLADYARDVPGDWDFSADSVNLLERVVVGRLKTLDDFEVPANHDFVEGAVWYLGEVFCRHSGMRWHYNEGEPDPDNMWIGRPYVDRTGPNANAAVPYYTLRNTVRHNYPGYLRERIDFFTY